jgi:hypothetical protein
MKRLAGNEKPIVVVEAVLDPVGVDFAIVRIDIDIRHVQVTIVVTPDFNMQDIIRATALRVLLGLNLIWGLLIPPISYTEYLHFLRLENGSGRRRIRYQSAFIQS